MLTLNRKSKEPLHSEKNIQISEEPNGGISWHSHFRATKTQMVFTVWLLHVLPVLIWVSLSVLSQSKDMLVWSSGGF